MKKVKVIKRTVDKDKKNNIHHHDKVRVAAYVRVSTDDEEQLNSFEAQMKYYTDTIKANPDWEFVGMYADEGITGTQIKKRDEFRQMIRDALNGKFDLIITKSISRFARNTVDTLKYVRMLKEKDIAVYFERENINTLTMDGEVLLTILSSLAQQESESISQNVKMGMKMKMQRGEMVGRGRCLGYDYDAETQTLSVNEKEAEIVRYIFKRYLEGAGGRVIANELTANDNYYTVTGKKKWNSTTVLRVIENVKYKGDLLLGKYITTDPITHRTIRNMGEREQYYVENHHEPIISREDFNKAQEILKKRRGKRNKVTGTRTKYSRKYAFSSITYCGFCGARVERRVWHSNKPWRKHVWTCSNYSLNGKQACPKCKGVDERLIEDAFVQTFNKLREDDMEVIKEFIQDVSEVLNSDENKKEIEKVENRIDNIMEKMNRLIDMRLNNDIDEYIYKIKYEELSGELDILRKALVELESANEGENVIKNRIKELQDFLLEEDKILVEFDRNVFDKIVDKVILGSSDNGIDSPYTVTFKLKSGLSYFNEIIFDDHKTGGKNTYSYSNIKTPISRHMNTLYVLSFSYDFGSDGRFKKKGENDRNIRDIDVKIAI